MKNTFRITPETRARFFARTRLTADAGSCWIWTGSLDAYGYGIIHVNGKTVKATHVALQLSGSPRPSKNAAALHSCDNPRCIRPTHLRWGTQTENIKDMDERKRRVSVRGNDHGNAKLTEDAVRVIRASSLQSSVLAAIFGVKPFTIREVRRRRTWRHI